MGIVAVASAVVLLLGCPSHGSKPDALLWWFQELSGSAGVQVTSMPRTDEYRIYRSLWFHSQRFIGLEDANASGAPGPLPIETTMSLNIMAITLPVADAGQFSSNVQAAWWPGNTVMIDVPFPAFPDNMGHWVEVLLPLHSVLAAGAWRGDAGGGSGTVDRLLLVNVRRASIEGLDWVWKMLGLALAPGRPAGAGLPTVVCYDELEAMDPRLWLNIENLVIANDRYTHPRKLGGFSDPAVGRAFRDAAYDAAGLARPPAWRAGPAPATITLLSAVTGEIIANREELVQALEVVGDRLGMRIRPYSATAANSFASYVSVMSKTGLLVARHGPLLANTAFLPPGAMVLELLPYNWEWKGISELYVNVTRSLGDVHHFAWRANESRWASYADADEARYKDWTPEECASRHCMEVHARAAMVAHTHLITAMLLDVLPATRAGARVEELAKPWPPPFKHTGQTGLWWDK